MSLNPVSVPDLVAALNRLVAARLPNGQWMLEGDTHSAVTLCLLTKTADGGMRTYSRHFSETELRVMGPDEWFIEADDMLLAMEESSATRG